MLCLVPAGPFGRAVAGAGVAWRGHGIHVQCFFVSAAV